MSLTQFAMVEELACLIKDNLPCKHLVLSVEQTLVDFLKDNTSSHGVLELEPMNPYNRLLLHRLADIFGFSHKSVGEGDDRHLVFERCLDTAVPSILVSDLLWQYDDVQSQSISHLLSRRREASPELERKVRDSFEVITLEEREAAYMAARERIFSTEEHASPLPPKKQEKKPQSDPVVAKRMIAHALGKRMAPPQLLRSNGTTDKGKSDITEKDEHLKKEQQQQQQQLGAAKRMFANALGLQSMRRHESPNTNTDSPRRSTSQPSNLERQRDR